eukprot:SAG31_NODE_2749_length_5147_cov_1.972662_3_plen_143_part_00
MIGYMQWCLYALMLGSSVLALHKAVVAVRATPANAPAATIPALQEVSSSTPCTAPADVEKIVLVNSPQPETEPERTTGSTIRQVPETRLRDEQARWWLARIVAGNIAGFGSAMTGTSGPVVSMPMFFLLGWSAHEVRQRRTD